MKTLSFFTTPIFFQSEQELMSFVSFHQSLYVHPTNFRCADGSTIQDEFKGEPLDGNRIVGSPINLEINEDDCSVVMSGNGGLDFCRVITKYDEYLESSDILGNFMDTVFNYKLSLTNPDLELYIETINSETSEKEIKKIRMGEYYSQEMNIKRYDKKKQEVDDIHQQIMELQEKHKQLTYELGKLGEIAHPQTSDLPF